MAYERVDHGVRPGAVRRGRTTPRQLDAGVPRRDRARAGDPGRADRRPGARPQRSRSGRYGQPPRRLYRYCIDQLIAANVDKDPDPLDDVRLVIGGLLDAWVRRASEHRAPAGRRCSCSPRRSRPRTSEQPRTHRRRPSRRRDRRLDDRRPCDRATPARCTQIDPVMLRAGASPCSPRRRAAIAVELADLGRQRAELARRHRGVAGYTRSGG